MTADNRDFTALVVTIVGLTVIAAIAAWVVGRLT